MVRDVMHVLAPEGSLSRTPGVKKRKQRGHLTGEAIMQEIHFDGHEKLGCLALRMGEVGIPIYGGREHACGKILYMRVVPNDRDPATIGHCYLDLLQTIRREYNLISYMQGNIDSTY